MEARKTPKMKAKACVTDRRNVLLGSSKKRPRKPPNTAIKTHSAVNSPGINSEEEAMQSCAANAPMPDNDVNNYYKELTEKVRCNNLLTEEEKQCLIRLLERSRPAYNDTAAANCSSSCDASPSLGSNTLVSTNQHKEIQVDMHPNVTPLLNFLKNQSHLKDNERDTVGIEKVMSATFVDRVNFILQQELAISLIQDVYPPLFSKKELILEFGRYTGIDVAETFHAKLKLYCSAIIELAQPTSSAIKLYSAAEKNADTDEKKQYLTCAAALLALPSLLKTDLRHFIKFNSEKPNTCFPVVTCTSDLKNCLTEVPELKIYADKHCICECNDLIEAFLVFVAIHYVFSIEYSNAVVKTATLIEMLLLDIPASCEVNPATEKVKDMILSKHNASFQN